MHAWFYRTGVWHMTADHHDLMANLLNIALRIFRWTIINDVMNIRTVYTPIPEAMVAITTHNGDD